MMSPRRSSTLLLIALTLTAGCTATEPAKETADAGVYDFGAGLGGVMGQVLDESQLPIPGAKVVIDAFDAVVTDETGTFTVNGLALGPHVVTASADGYETASTEVDLSQRTLAEVRFVLPRLASADAYIEVLNFRGYSYCEIATYTGTQQPEFCQGLGANNNFLTSVNGTWRYLVSELTWHTGIGGSDSMRLVHSRNESCSSGDPCYGVVFGTHYARMEGEPGQTEVVTYYDPYSDDRGPPYPNETFDMRIFVHWIGMGREYYTLPAVGEYCSQTMPLLVNGARYKPGCFGWGVSTGIPFDVWLSIFHLAGPADRGACCPATEYTALPDA